MRLKFVTFSGANEHTDIDEFATLLSSFWDIAEAGIQVSGKKAFFGSPRYLWIKMLYYKLKSSWPRPNLALHLTQDWAGGFFMVLVLSGCYQELISKFLRFPRR